ncbi:MAG TPA: asparagine synthase (glutamine-hydrolyzing) [Puia sp.]|nr:asparagine synthase (glutamine-hydrolyzing) [Puia sp.]
MCGIAGIINFGKETIEGSLIQKMTDSMAHRGPDADSYYIEGGIALGHRRLSIIDLSSAANQPFTDASGRYVIVFNGEIYNYAEVKALVADYPFHTTSDTEALIAAYAKWGSDCLRHLKGMFAFAIWDKQKQELFIARDRLGVKPLYYFLNDQYLLFASEIRAILATNKVSREIDADALADYFRFQSFCFPDSPVKNVLQLEAGSWAVIRRGKMERSTYWNVAARPVDFDFSDRTLVQKRVRELLLQSVSRRLVSDVPVGAFLSGGIDSSAIVGLMAEAGSSKPNTFNISFGEKEYDESVYAKMIAGRFDTNHTTILLQPEMFLEELPNALGAMDSPSGDGVNTYVVSKAIRQNGMTVALSGVGGDELFAGYPFFMQYLQLQKLSWLWKAPSVLRKLAAGAAFTVNKGGRTGRIGQLLQMQGYSIDQAYPVFRQILSPRLLRELTTLGDGGSHGQLEVQLAAKKEDMGRLPLLSQVSAAEYLGYTQQTLLKDTDQMGMAASLEIREPFFDHDLLEFVLAIPDSIKKPEFPKSLLVRSLAPMLPDEIVFRKKQGFLFPWNIWLRNELRSFCDGMINNMAQRPFINGKNLLAYWKRFLKEDPNIRWSEIWLFAVLEYWLEKNQIS